MSMNCRCAAVGLSLLGLLAIAPESARCNESDLRPLRLSLASPLPSADQRANTAQRRPAPMIRGNGDVTAGIRRPPGFVPAEPSLRQRALQSLVDPTEQNFSDTAPSSRSSTANFHFEHEGPAVRNLQRSYKNLCTTVSSKIWNEPNGRRVKFDVAGKPGFAVEIPLH
jgi:hypothetical protein